MAGHRADMMKLVKLAKKNGCSVQRTGNGHWGITTPSGAYIVASFSPRTPGAYRDTIRDLRKAGVSL
jgi:hypothetical protein